MASTKRVLVYGGKGALGATCVEAFKSNEWVCIFKFHLLSLTLFPTACLFFSLLVFALHACLCVE